MDDRESRAKDTRRCDQRLVIRRFLKAVSSHSTSLRLKSNGENRFFRGALLDSNAWLAPTAA